jgi:hypothetical protein
VVVNLLHLIPEAAVQSALAGIAEVLAPGGIAVLYGPFLRDGETTSDGDAAFHAELSRRDPSIGYKDVLDVVAQNGRPSAYPMWKPSECPPTTSCSSSKNAVRGMDQGLVTDRAGPRARRIVSLLWDSAAPGDAR